MFKIGKIALIFPQVTHRPPNTTLTTLVVTNTDEHAVYNAIRTLKPTMTKGPFSSILTYILKLILYTSNFYSLSKLSKVYTT